MATAGKLEYLISVDSSGVQRGLDNTESKVKGFGNKLSAWTVAKGQMIGRLVERAGASTVRFFGDSITESRGFDKAMSQVAATLGKTTDEMSKEVRTTSVKFGKEVKTFTGNMAEFARFMGQNTAFSATEAAEALNYMALAGYDTEKSMRMLPTVLNLAAAGNMDLARSSDMVTDAQSALGLSIEGTERMVDQMAKTASKTNTSVEQLGDAFLTVGGTAKVMGSGMIDTTTELSMALGVLADNGIKGSEGGTALRNILLALTAPTDKAAKKLKELGIEVFDADGNMRDLPFIMEDMNKAMEGMTSEERMDFLSTVFNKRDLKAIEALLGTDMSRWEELYGDIGNANGAAAEMAETQLDNLEGDITKLKSAVSEARLSIADKLTPALRNLVQKGTVWVTRLTDAFNENGFGGALKEAGSLMRETVAEYFGLGTDARWTDIGKAAAKKIKNGIKNQFKKAKLKVTEMLGLDEGASWGEIASGIKSKITEKLKGAKVKIADWLGVDDPSSATWGDIARNIGERIKGKIGEAKIKIADLLGVEEPENATWGDIAGKIVERIKGKIGEAKLKIADLLGIEDAEDATWGDIAGNIVERIKGKVGQAKLKIADLLGVEEPENATWGDIAGNITERIKGKLTNAKIKIADILGIEDAEDATWGDIAGNITTRIKAKVGDAKLKIADLLGIEEPGDATWSDIAGKIKERLSAGMSNLKLKAADIFGLENPEDATWADIGKKIMDGLTKYVSNKGNFLKQLILGDEYTDKSTWMDVGKKLTGWLEEAFAEGGILDAMLGNATDKAAAIATFAGNLISGIADWISTNSSAVAGMITNIVGALVQAAPKVAEALSLIFQDTGFQDAFSQLIVAAFNASMEILGSLFEMLGDILGKAIFGEEWYEMKKKEKERVQSETGSYKEGNEDWNAKAEAIDEKYNMHVTEGTDSTGAQTDAVTATMMHLGIGGGIPTWWSESKLLNQLVDLRKLSSGADNPYMYEVATAGTRAFGDAWQQGLRGEELSAAVQEAMEAIEPPEIKPEIKVSDGEVNKVLGLFDGVAINIPVHFLVDGGGEITNEANGGGYTTGHSFAKGEWDVPHDMYAKLHRNETVLNATQARQYREGKAGGDTSEVVGALQSLRNDLSNLQLVVGRKTFGRAVVNYGGNRMNDYIGGSESRLAAGYGT